MDALQNRILINKDRSIENEVNSILLGLIYIISIGNNKISVRSHRLKVMKGLSSDGNITLCLIFEELKTGLHTTYK